MFLIKYNFSFIKNNILIKKINSHVKLGIKKNKNLIINSDLYQYEKYINNEKNLFLGKNKNQLEYINFLNDDQIKIIFSLGPAGTGKTFLACHKAINDLKNCNINKIVITRPIILGDDDIGFLPGNLIKKMEPWTNPIFDIFRESYTQTEIDRLIFDNKIEICPLIYMRGRTFKNSFIIADEMQNSNDNQMKMLLSRLGFNSRLVITGDLEQKDNIKCNGIDDFMSKFLIYKKKNQFIDDKIKVINFNNDDVERSEIVKNILNIYNINNISSSNDNISSNVTSNIIFNNNNSSNNNIKYNKKKNNFYYNNDSALIPFNEINSKNHKNFYGI